MFTPNYASDHKWRELDDYACVMRSRLSSAVSCVNDYDGVDRNSDEYKTIVTERKVKLAAAELALAEYQRDLDRRMWIAYNASTREPFVIKFKA